MLHIWLYRKELMPTKRWKHPRHFYTQVLLIKLQTFRFFIVLVQPYCAKNSPLPVKWLTLLTDFYNYTFFHAVNLIFPQEWFLQSLRFYSSDGSAIVTSTRHQFSLHSLAPLNYSTVAKRRLLFHRYVPVSTFSMCYDKIFTVFDTSSSNY